MKGKCSAHEAIDCGSWLRPTCDLHPTGKRPRVLQCGAPANAIVGVARTARQFIVASLISVLTTVRHTHCELDKCDCGQLTRPLCRRGMLSVPPHRVLVLRVHVRCQHGAGHHLIVVRPAHCRRTNHAIASISSAEYPRRPISFPADAPTARQR